MARHCCSAITLDSASGLPPVTVAGAIAVGPNRADSSLIVDRFSTSIADSLAVMGGEISITTGGDYWVTADNVATHRPDTLDWQNSHALEGNLADAIRALKQQDGVNLLTWGGADTVRQLLAAGLVDELRLMIYPVLLGCGKRLFGDNAQPSAFTLAHSIGAPGGVLLTRYTRSGEVRTGAFVE